VDYLLPLSEINQKERKRKQTVVEIPIQINLQWEQKHFIMLAISTFKQKYLPRSGGFKSTFLLYLVHSLFSFSKLSTICSAEVSQQNHITTAGSG